LRLKISHYEKIQSKIEMFQLSNGKWHLFVTPTFLGRVRVKL